MPKSVHTREASLPKSVQTREASPDHEASLLAGAIASAFVTATSLAAVPLSVPPLHPANLLCGLYTQHLERDVHTK